MQQNKITILSTRPLHASIIRDAAIQGVSISTESFIETEPIQSVEVQQEIEQALLQTVSVVFTSMNAVEAVAAYIDNELPQWKIYCIGQTTRELVIKYFGENSIAGTADNAVALANLVVEDEMTGEVIFFCGNQRRNELPDILEHNNIPVTEIVVYRTMPTPHAVQQTYNGILFYSPSAADSFFSGNRPGNQTVFFAIGSTTAAAIKKYSSNNIITAGQPGKENLVQKAIDYFVHSER